MGFQKVGLWWVAAVLAATASGAEAQELEVHPPEPWWRSAVVYQVFPRSFRDSDSDGSGDLRGITEKAGYFKELGVDAVLLIPFYTSPWVDGGYDVANHTDVDPLFGNMQDFDDLVARLKELDIKLILDFVPNHTSDEHPWFLKSVQGDPDYRDFYIWMDPERGKNMARQPPNNWMSASSGPAWEWRDERQQYYLHLFHKKQPDLNYRNSAVVGNMTAVLQFWLDKGVDGFRITGDAFLYKYKDLRMNAPAIPGTDGTTYLTQSHKYYTDQPETFALIRHWADMLYNRGQQDKRERILLLEHYDENAKNFYGQGKESLAMSVCFNLLLHTNQATKAPKYKEVIEECLSHVPLGDVTAWSVSSQDKPRLPVRYGPEMVDAINMLTGVLPGIQLVYYGDEIGMTDTFLPYEQTSDPAGAKLGPQHDLVDGGTRDTVRTPMQWDNTTNAGFSRSYQTWLPVNPNYWWLNVAAQAAAPASHLKVFQALTRARRDPVLLRGDLSVAAPDSDTLAVTRSLDGIQFLLLINLGNKIIRYNREAGPQLVSVVVGSINSGYTAGQKIEPGPYLAVLRPKAAVLLKLVTPTPSAAGLNELSLPLAATAAVLVITIAMLGL